MKTCFRSAGSSGSGLKKSKRLVSRQPSFSAPAWAAAPTERLFAPKPQSTGRPAGLIHSSKRTAQVLLRRQCSEDGSADSNFWEQDAEDSAPDAGSPDHNLFYEEWKALQQRLGSNYAASYDGSEVWSVPRGRRDFLDGQLMWNDLNQVYVIVYAQGVNVTEGIYTIRTERPDHDGLPSDTIVAFENLEDAERYATVLAAQTRHVGKVCAMAPRELLAFCVDAGYNCRLEPQGTLLTPPEIEAPISEWERTVKLRDEQWTVQDRDVLPRDPCEGEFCTPDTNLVEARARLEKLLTQESEDLF
ncbi:hypothetical protein WJX84_005674 [Apatococcus fuscideae]|uniref:Uncharacterized protein n=1 Tax=Apatococcus fuscideae TaxID=2026836 RepID=A0AAW1ST18_9CHLO